jgi:hypothetical protein
MTSNAVRIDFMELIKREFPLVKFIEKKMKSGDLRISPYVTNDYRNKRWMQLDANPKYLSIAMDHYIGDIGRNDLENLGLEYGLNKKESSIQLQNNHDAINISIFNTHQFDFNKKEFIEFLHKHYQSYLKRVNVTNGFLS